MKRIAASTALAILLAAPAGAQSPLGTRRDRTAIEPAAPPCDEFRVESQVTIRQEDAGDESREARFGFIVSVTVTNRCPEALEVRYGSSVEYRTSFAPSSGGAPPGCAGQQWSFSGVALPNQKTPFVHHVEGCPIALPAAEPPRVAIESGRVLTPWGEAPVPAVNRTFP